MSAVQYHIGGVFLRRKIDRHATFALCASQLHADYYTNWHDNAMMLHLGRKRIVGFRITVSGLELIAADVAQNTVYNIF